MIFGRKDYDEHFNLVLDTWVLKEGNPIEDDEPVFLLRSTDIHALETIRCYRRFVMQDVRLDTIEKFSIIISLGKHLRRMLKWQKSHPERMKSPTIKENYTYDDGLE